MDDARLIVEAGIVKLRPLRLRPQDSVGVFELSIQPSHPDIDLGGPVEIGLYRSDLERLVSLLRGHVDDVIADTAGPSLIYVPSELGFQLQLFEGEADGPMDGCFSLALSLRRRLEPSGRGVYYGFEGIALLNDIYIFCAGLDLFIASLTKI